MASQIMGTINNFCFGSPLFSQLSPIPIIKNAIVYTPNKGAITINLETEKDKKSILMSVKDNGIGIPRLQQEHIFEKFFRADNAIPFFTDGAGLGLFVAKSIIEEHGGQIWFKSQETQCSTFYVSLKY